MTYTPGRTERFHYLMEVIQFVEDNQCRGCGLSKLADPDESKSHAEEFPMCYEIEAKLIQEEPVDELDDLGSDGVVCTRYRDRELVEQEHPDQGRLL